MHRSIFFICVKIFCLSVIPISCMIQRQSPGEFYEQHPKAMVIQKDLSSDAVYVKPMHIYIGGDSGEEPSDELADPGDVQPDVAQDMDQQKCMEGQIRGLKRRMQPGKGPYRHYDYNRHQSVRSKHPSDDDSAQYLSSYHSSRNDDQFFNDRFEADEVNGQGSNTGLVKRLGAAHVPKYKLGPLIQIAPPTWNQKARDNLDYMAPDSSFKDYEDSGLGGSPKGAKRRTAEKPSTLKPLSKVFGSAGSSLQNSNHDVNQRSASSFARTRRKEDVKIDSRCTGSDCKKHHNCKGCGNQHASAARVAPEGKSNTARAEFSDLQEEKSRAEMKEAVANQEMRMNKRKTDEETVPTSVFKRNWERFAHNERAARRAENDIPALADYDEGAFDEEDAEDEAENEEEEGEGVQREKRDDDEGGEDEFSEGAEETMLDDEMADDGEELAEDDALESEDTDEGDASFEENYQQKLADVRADDTNNFQTESHELSNAAGKGRKSDLTSGTRRKKKRIEAAPQYFEENIRSKRDGETSSNGVAAASDNNPLKEDVQPQSDDTKINDKVEGTNLVEEHAQLGKHKDEDSSKEDGNNPLDESNRDALDLNLNTLDTHQEKALAGSADVPQKDAVKSAVGVAETTNDAGHRGKRHVCRQRRRQLRGQEDSR